MQRLQFAWKKKSATFCFLYVTMALVYRLILKIKYLQLTLTNRGRAQLENNLTDWDCPFLKKLLKNTMANFGLKARQEKDLFFMWNCLVMYKSKQPKQYWIRLVV